MDKVDEKTHAADLKARIAAFTALSEPRRMAIDSGARRLRKVFQVSCNGIVWGEAMLPWDELPEENRQHWREVFRTTTGVEWLFEPGPVVPS